MVVHKTEEVKARFNWVEFLGENNIIIEPEDTKLMANLKKV
jgi:hypothetical protein